MKLNTWDQWREQGCVVILGQHAKEKNEKGEWVFSECQVTYIGQPGDGDADYDDDDQIQDYIEDVGDR